MNIKSLIQLFDLHYEMFSFFLANILGKLVEIEGRMGLQMKPKKNCDSGSNTLKPCPNF